MSSQEICAGRAYVEMGTEDFRIQKAMSEKLAAENAILRKALVGLVGSDSREDLEQMEATIRMMPIPDIDRSYTINAIQALLQTKNN